MVDLMVKWCWKANIMRKIRFLSCPAGNITKSESLESNKLYDRGSSSVTIIMGCAAEAISRTPILGIFCSGLDNIDLHGSVIKIIGTSKLTWANKLCQTTSYKWNWGVQLNISCVKCVLRCVLNMFIASINFLPVMICSVLDGSTKWGDD